MKIAILGWGSLLWDKRSEFDEQHENWQLAGPKLMIEFSRVSQTRGGALTLVLDSNGGMLCQVAYAFSKRNNPNDAICDIRSREGTTLKNVGFCFTDNSQKQARNEEVLITIKKWASEKKIDVVIWTDLESNFQNKYKKPFSVDAAIHHIQSLDNEGKIKAVEYVQKAPIFVKTSLRKALKSQSWFKNTTDN